MSDATITINVYIKDLHEPHDDRTDIMDAVKDGKFDVVSIHSERG